MDPFQETADGTVVSLRVVPRASRNAVEGLHGDAVKVRLQAPPVEGKANKALLRFLAEHLDLPAARLSLVKGDKSRTKRVLVTGMGADELRRRLLAGPDK